MLDELLTHLYYANPLTQVYCLKITHLRRHTAHAHIHAHTPDYHFAAATRLGIRTQTHAHTYTHLEINARIINLFALTHRQASA